MDKTCSKCKETKPLSEYHKDRSQRDGHRSDCTICARKTKADYMRRNKEKYKKSKRCYNLQRNYGITLEDYGTMFDGQQGRCKICGKHEDDQDRSLAVDHCHDTGDIRGLLCSNCNRSLGYFNDNIDSLLKAIEYLKGDDHV